MPTRTQERTDEALTEHSQRLQDRLLEQLWVSLEPEPRRVGRPTNGPKAFYGGRHGLKHHRRKSLRRWLPAPKLQRKPRSTTALFSLWGQCPDCLDVFSFDIELEGGAQGQASAQSGLLKVLDSRVRKETSGSGAVLTHRPCRRPFRILRRSSSQRRRNSWGLLWERTRMSGHWKPNASWREGQMRVVRTKPHGTPAERGPPPARTTLS